MKPKKFQTLYHFKFKVTTYKMIYNFLLDILVYFFYYFVYICYES